MMYRFCAPWQGIEFPELWRKPSSHSHRFMLADIAIGTSKTIDPVHSCWPYRNSRGPLHRSWLVCANRSLAIAIMSLPQLATRASGKRQCLLRYLLKLIVHWFYCSLILVHRLLQLIDLRVCLLQVVGIGANWTHFLIFPLRYLPSISSSIRSLLSTSNSFSGLAFQIVDSLSRIKRVLCGQNQFKPAAQRVIFVL